MADKKRAPSSSTNSVSNKTSSLANNIISGALPVHRIKVLSMGSINSGKSCIIKRFCEERFVSKYIATIGVDYGVKPVEIENMNVKVNFWDLSGHPEVNTMNYKSFIIHHQMKLTYLIHLYYILYLVF